MRFVFALPELPPFPSAGEGADLHSRANALCWLFVAAFRVCVVPAVYLFLLLSSATAPLSPTPFPLYSVATCTAREVTGGGGMGDCALAHQHTANPNEDAHSGKKGTDVDAAVCISLQEASAALSFPAVLCLEAVGAVSHVLRGAAPPLPLWVSQMCFGDAHTHVHTGHGTNGEKALWGARIRGVEGADFDAVGGLSGCGEGRWLGLCGGRASQRCPNCEAGGVASLSGGRVFACGAACIH